MTKSELTIRPATREDIIAWFGKAPYRSQAFAGVIDGRVVALFGVYRTPDNFVAFCAGGENIRRRRKDVIRMIRFFREILQNYPLVVAWADRNEPTSHSFLNHVGFSFERSTPQGELFSCRRI